MRVSPSFGPIPSKKALAQIHPRATIDIDDLAAEEPLYNHLRTASTALVWAARALNAASPISIASVMVSPGMSTRFMS
ncbi:MAG: hypothetical protein R2855_10130 [Thermomicrobiales bacterium]